MITSQGPTEIIPEFCGDTALVNVNHQDCNPRPFMIVTIDDFTSGVAPLVIATNRNTEEYPDKKGANSLLTYFKKLAKGQLDSATIGNIMWLDSFQAKQLDQTDELLKKTGTMIPVNKKDTALNQKTMIFGMEIEMLV